MSSGVRLVTSWFWQTTTSLSTTFAPAFAFMDDKKPVFAICHGPQLLINAKALDGRKATGFTSIRIDMENAGANVVDIHNIRARVFHVDSD